MLHIQTPKTQKPRTVATDTRGRGNSEALEGADREAEKPQRKDCPLLASRLTTIIYKTSHFKPASDR